VADRFHLLQNLRHTIEQQLSRAPHPAKPPASTDAAVEPWGTVACDGRDGQSALAEHRQLVRAGRRGLRTSMFDQVKTLQARGDDIRAIARRTGLNWRTVEKWSWLEELPLRNIMGPKLTTPSTFQDHLSRRWAEGCTSGRTLLPEIKRLGYAGSFSHLERLLCRWRAAGCSGAADVSTLLALTEATEPSLASTGHLASPIVAAALCVKPRGLLTTSQAAKVDALKAASPDFAAMRALAMRFRGILRGKDIRSFAAWLQDADRCGVYGMRRFVRTLRQDLDAVRNAITEPWSNGQTEGQINRHGIAPSADDAPSRNPASRSLRKTRLQAAESETGATSHIIEQPDSRCASSSTWPCARPRRSPAASCACSGLICRFRTTPRSADAGERLPAGARGRRRASRSDPPRVGQHRFGAVRPRRMECSQARPDPTELAQVASRR
jgi:hypothetical protein